VRHRQLLAVHHAEKKQKEAEERMRELHLIAQQEQNRKEELDAIAAQAAEGLEDRMAEMDFGGFSFGASRCV
jgi:hypothetical protein